MHIAHRFTAHMQRAVNGSPPDSGEKRSMGTDSALAGAPAGAHTAFASPAGTDGARLHHGDHTVQFYESDAALTEPLAGFFGDGLRAGEGVVFVATRAHREAVAARLRRAGIDPDEAASAGLYLAIDAAEAAASITVEGHLDRDGFMAFAYDALDRVGVNGRPVRVFGELGALLAKDDHETAVIEEEWLWNELRQSRPLTLYCAYSLRGLTGERRVAFVNRICDAHDRIVPGESYAALDDPDDRARAIVLLQQKAASLEAEMAERMRKDQLLAAQSRVLEMIARRSPLRDTLEMLIQEIEEQDAKWCASILVRDPDEDRFCMGIAPSMPDGYISTIANGSILPPYRSPCCQAAHRGLPIVTTDASTDERWPDDWRRLTVGHGLLTCYSFPIITSDGTVLGTFSTYDRAPRDAHPPAADLIETATHLAAIAIERSREEAEHARLLAQKDEARAEAEALYHTGQLLAAELDPDKLLQAITDAATALAGAEHGAFFYTVTDEHGASYMLYTLSGAPREQFADLPMPRNTELFQTTFSGKGTVRLDDVTKDPRFGTNAPYFGLPEGHLPLTSYLAVPVVARDGEVLGGLFFGHRQPGVFTERSERLVAGMAATAATAIENARLYEQVRQAVRFRDDFLASVAHDLKTPLTSIKGRAQLLRRQLAKVAPTGLGRLDEGLANIDATAAMMQDQLDELLDVSRTVIGQERVLQREPTDLVALARQVAEVQLFAKRHRIRIETARDELIGEWDQQRLARVIGNLLSNAIKYSPPGSEIVITVAQPEHGWATLSVTDQGMGVPAADRARIFERFQRARNVPKETAGTGIGLASAKQVVEQHGGTITLVSEVGAGSTFTVRLPLAGDGHEEP